MTPADDTVASCDVHEQGSAENVAALHNLANCFYWGQGRVQDHTRARALYRAAAGRGFAKSMCGLGNMMVRGEGGSVDLDGGLQLCRRAAEAGDVDAQADLGGYFLAGEVVVKDVVVARKWLRLAAERGHANAAMELGKIYWNGDGIGKDNAAAARWWRVAFEGGRKDAALPLGEEAFVRIGRGVSGPQDASLETIDEAIRWLDTAAASDPRPAARAKAGTQAGQLRRFRQALLSNR